MGSGGIASSSTEEVVARKAHNIHQISQFLITRLKQHGGDGGGVGVGGGPGNERPHLDGPLFHPGAPSYGHAGQNGAFVPLGSHAPLSPRDFGPAGSGHHGGGERFNGGHSGSASSAARQHLSYAAPRLRDVHHAVGAQHVLTNINSAGAGLNNSQFETPGYHLATSHGNVIAKDSIQNAALLGDRARLCSERRDSNQPLSRCECSYQNTSPLSGIAHICDTHFDRRQTNNCVVAPSNRCCSSHNKHPVHSNEHSPPPVGPNNDSEVPLNLAPQNRYSPQSVSAARRDSDYEADRHGEQEVQGIENHEVLNLSQGKDRPIHSNVTSKAPHDPVELSRASHTSQEPMELSHTSHNVHVIQPMLSSPRSVTSHHSESSSSKGPSRSPDYQRQYSDTESIPQPTDPRSMPFQNQENPPHEFHTTVESNASPIIIAPSADHRHFVFPHPIGGVGFPATSPQTAMISSLQRMSQNYEQSRVSSASPPHRLHGQTDVSFTSSNRRENEPGFAYTHKRVRSENLYA